MPTKYSISQALNITSHISDYFDKNEDKYDIEGIFRVPGKQSQVEQLKAAFIRDNPELSEYDMHTICSMLKKVVGEASATGDAVKHELEQFKNNICHAADDAERMHQMSQLIDTLYRADDCEQQELGELLYHFMHIAKKTVEHQDSNKMNAKNIAMTLSLILMKLFGWDDGIKDAMAVETFKSTYLAPVVEAACQDTRYEFPFSVTYRALKQSRLDSLNAEIESTNQSSETLKQKLDKNQRDLSTAASGAAPKAAEHMAHLKVTTPLLMNYLATANHRNRTAKLRRAQVERSLYRGELAQGDVNNDLRMTCELVRP